MQNARIPAMCKLHLARVAINQPADTVGKGSGFMQPPLQSRKNVLYGSSPAGGNGKQVNDQFVHEVVKGKPSEQFQRFGIGNFGQIGKVLPLPSFSQSRSKMEWGKILASQRSRQWAKPFLWFITHRIDISAASGRKPSSVIAVTAWIFGIYPGF